MIYDFNLFEIIKKKLLLMIAMQHNHSLSIDEISQIKDDINIYNDLISLIFTKNECNINSSDFCDSSNLVTNCNLSHYDLIPRQILDDILGAIYKLNNDILIIDYDIPILNITDDQLVELSYDFFKWIPTTNKKYIDSFRQYTDKKNHHLKFGNDVTFCFGTTYYTNYPFYKPYFFINRKHDCDDFLSLNHELAHGLFHNSRFVNQDSFFIGELEGYFFEFLSIEFLKDKINREDINKLISIKYSDEFSRFTDIYIQDYVIRLFKNNKIFHIDFIKENISSKNLPFFIDYEVVDSAFIDLCDFIAQYLFSYLVSLDLQQIFKSDPEFSFYLFENIKTNTKDDLYTNLRKNGISFFEDDYQSLEKNIMMMKNLK